MALSDLDFVAMFGVPKIDATGYALHDYVSQLARTIDEIKATVSEYDTQAKHIRKSTDLTPAGQSRQLIVFGTETLGRLQRDGLLEASRKLLAFKRGSITVTPSDANDVARTLREQEVRSLLRQRDNLAVYEAWIVAIEKGDQLVFDAIRNAPSFAPLLVPDHLSQGEEMWAMKRDANLGKAVKDLAKAIDIVVKVIEEARAYVSKDAGLPKDDNFIRTQ